MVFIIKDSGINSETLKVAHKEIVTRRSIKASGKVITLYSIVNDDTVNALDMFGKISVGGGIK